MKKKLLVGGLVAVVFLGGLIYFRNKEKTQVLSSQTSATNSPKTVEKELPILEIFENTVEVNSVKAQNGQKVEVGSKIKTDANGRAQLVYPNNSVTRIDKNSEMVLQDFEIIPSVTRVKIEKGRIWSRIAKLFGKDDSYETQTNTLVASVRGTSFGHGILDDGSNKISVSRSEVIVDCANQEIVDVNVSANKKVTTKCSSKPSPLNWGGEEAGDEWFKWNLNQDKELDARFGESVYADQPTPTPKATIKPTPKPTIKPTPSPTLKPTATPTITPTPLPTPTASPSPTPTATSRLNAKPTPTSSPTLF
jgi:hypothetical protein